MERLLCISCVDCLSGHKLRSIRGNLPSQKRQLLRDNSKCFELQLDLKIRVFFTLIVSWNSMLPQGGCSHHLKIWGIEKKKNDFPSYLYTRSRSMMKLERGQLLVCELSRGGNGSSSVFWDWLELYLLGWILQFISVSILRVENCILFECEIPLPVNNLREKSDTRFCSAL